MTTKTSNPVCGVWGQAKYFDIAILPTSIAFAGLRWMEANYSRSSTGFAL